MAAGAGGHAGTTSPFALIQEIREWFDGPLALSGSIANGRSILAARAMGADFAYIGSAFIATEEARALAVRVLVWTSVFGFQPAPRDLFHPEDIASTPPKLHPPSNLSRSTRGRHGLDAPRRAP